MCIVCWCTNVHVCCVRQVVGAIVYLSGELEFINNTASAGDVSALHMLSFGQVVLSRGLTVNFHRNSGRSVMT